MSGAIKAYDSRLHQSNQGPRVHPSLPERRRDVDPVSLLLTLGRLLQPKGDCKVYYRSAELLHLLNSEASSAERFTASPCAVR